jgi:hypothetical protein
LHRRHSQLALDLQIDAETDVSIAADPIIRRPSEEARGMADAHDVVMVQTLASEIPIDPWIEVVRIPEQFLGA